MFKHTRRGNYRFVDELMAENTDLTSRQLYAAFKEAYPSMAVSVSTMKRASRYLGWTSKHTRYCQLISDGQYKLKHPPKVHVWGGISDSA